MKGTLEPSAPSITPSPCASIFFTIPVILSVVPVQPCSRSPSRSAIGWARNLSIDCAFPLAASPSTPFARFSRRNDRITEDINLQFMLEIRKLEEDDESRFEEEFNVWLSDDGTRRFTARKWTGFRTGRRKDTCLST